MQKALLMVALFATAALAGCASSDDAADDEPVFTEPTYTPGKTTNVTERVALPFNTTLGWSQTLEPGMYAIDTPRSVYVDIELPLTEGGSALLPTEDPIVHLGLFLPVIPGCDWNANDLPEACNVPVIADAGPYYTESDVDAEQRGSGRLGEFLISNFVPHGYAVAQISVFGSGKSNHCFDMFGLSEQLGVHGAVEWLGDQPWSNGNVGLIGRSYDGSTPWMAAAHASEDSALKTIVPISGLTGLQDLVTWNGASEARILLFQNVVYGTFGIGSDPANEVLRRATCPDWITATPWGAAGYASGDDVVDVEGTYWQERSMGDRVINNYRGSVYLIHGLKDDNVDPHAGWQLHKILEDGGWETKGLYGQWFHNYPDRLVEHGINSQGNVVEPANSIRYDWAQDLLEWFDHYLMEGSEKPALIIEVQEKQGNWRIDDALQPSNSEHLEVPLTSDVTVTPVAGGTVDLGVINADEDTVLGGLSTVHLSVTPTGPGGQVYVEFVDLTDGTDFGLAYGIMELRQSGNVPAPGVAMDIEIPMQYFSAILPAGHKLGLEIAGSGNDYLPSPIVAPVTVNAAGSHVALSVVHPEADDYFQPPEWLVDEA